MPERSLWFSDHAFAVVDPGTKKLWGGRGWVDLLWQARFYVSWEAAEKAIERSPFLTGAVPVAVGLTIASDSVKRVQYVDQLRKHPPARSLFDSPKGNP